MKAATLTIGTEILIGQIIDTNSAYLGEQLHLIGMDVVKNISIADDQNLITDTLHQLSKEVDVIIMTGGLGPTKDDITKVSIADFLNAEMYYEPKVYNHIEEIYARFNRVPTDLQKQQCYFPKGTIFLTNQLGTAPGMMFQYNDVLLFSMPGVPYEMKHIFENEIVKILADKKKDYFYHKTILTIGQGETIIAEKIADIEEQLPDYMSLAYLPSLGRVRLRVSGKHTDESFLKSSVDQWVEKLESRLSDIVFGYDNDQLTEKIGELLVQRNMTLVTAESCTGGLIADLITDVPGSSAYFEGSVVSYSNFLKNKILNVPISTIETYGAVSEETVKSMLNGVLDLTKADVGIAVSGIAGPGGGTPEKPVGTVWLAVGSESEVQTTKLQLKFDRLQNIEYSAFAALNMLRKFLRRQ